MKLNLKTESKTTEMAEKLQDFIPLKKTPCFYCDINLTLTPVHMILLLISQKKKTSNLFGICFVNH